MEQRPVEILKIEKLAEVLDGINENTVKSIVAVKSGTYPLIHLVAVPHNQMEKVWGILKLLNVNASFVEVIEDNFGKQEVLKEQAAGNA